MPKFWGGLVFPKTNFSVLGQKFGLKGKRDLKNHSPQKRAAKIFSIRGGQFFCSQKSRFIGIFSGIKNRDPHLPKKRRNKKKFTVRLKEPGENLGIV